MCLAHPDDDGVVRDAVVNGLRGCVIVCSSRVRIVSVLLLLRLLLLRLLLLFVLAQGFHGDARRT